jgi:hypothetical protein
LPKFPEFEENSTDSEKAPVPLVQSVVMDRVIRPHVVNFRCERWRAPAGTARAIALTALENLQVML